MKSTHPMMSHQTRDSGSLNHLALELLPGVTTFGATGATNSGASTEATTSGSSGVATFKSVSASPGK